MTSVVIGSFPAYRAGFPALQASHKIAPEPAGLRPLSDQELDDVAGSGLLGALAGAVVGGVIGAGISIYAYGRLDAAVIGVSAGSGALFGAIVTGAV